MVKNSYILITGAAGFIGAALSNKLLYSGENVIGIDDLNNYYDPSLKAKIENIAKNLNNNSGGFLKKSHYLHQMSV